MMIFSSPIRAIEAIPHFPVFGMQIELKELKDDANSAAKNSLIIEATILALYCLKNIT
jgi:hypothetical protein